MAGLRVYRQLLQNRPLSRLLLGEFVSGIGDWLYIIAIFVVIYRESGDAALVGTFGGIRLLPYVVLSVPAGVVADRFDRRMVLLVSDLFRGSLMVLMAIGISVGASTLLIAALAICAAGGSSFFYPALGAYLPSLVTDERQLGPANSAWASLQNVSYIIGPAIGGVVLALGSVQAAFIINALTFVFVAFILWFLPPSRPSDRAAATAAAEAARAEASTAEATATTVTATAGMTAKSPASARAQLKIRPLAGFSLVQLIAGFLGGGFQVITVILAIDVLKAGEEANGYLNAAIGIGGLLGAITAGNLVLRRGLGMPLLIGAVVMGVGTIALGAANNLGFALIAIGVSAAGALIIDVTGTTIFQRLVPDEMRGRGYGVLMAFTTLTGVAGAIALPVLVTTVGPFESLAATGIAAIVFTSIGLVLIGTAADRAATPYEATIARILGLPLFTGVPSARVEAALHKVVEVPVKAGEVVVQQGEPADRFYIIENGAFTVSQVPAPGAPPDVLRSLGPDDVFGELGLLNRTPRTATVTADMDGVVLALGADDFLALVGAGGPLRGRLQGLYVGGGSGPR
ncbi:MAG TPA: MFS transporter [Candidatus Limnocylindrales bacterium]